MGQFLVVEETPASVGQGEYVIEQPNFLKEIALHKTKTPKNGLTGSFHLRMILDSIAQNYDPQNMTAYSCKVHHFEGLAFSTDEELNSILVKMLQKDYPAVFTKYLDTRIRNRPKGAEKIYYVESGLSDANEVFYKNGFSEATE
jgi:hypothetical protein